MNKRIYSARLDLLMSSELLREASADELRVLLALASGAYAEQVSELTGVSAHRVVSAISLWVSAGILESHDLIEEEFKERIIPSEIDEQSAVRVARDIRDSGLNALMSECAGLMKKAALSTTEVKKIAALYTQYSLSEEFILTLAAHLADKGKLTATRLASEAIKLTERDIDTPEELIAYIDEKKKTSDTEARMRRVFGIYGRSITKSEQKFFKKWVEEFGYSENIILQAYDITVANTERYMPSYIDKILSRWHECGCKTLEECMNRKEIDKKTIAAERSATKKTAQKKDDAAMKYGAFNAEDALMSALMRSYGEKED